MGCQPTGSSGDSNPKAPHADDPIVIVGAACRLAGEASSLTHLWDMMKGSRIALAEVPKDCWNADAWYHPDPDRKGSLNTKHGFFLEQDMTAFDAPFFTVNAKEAAGMDPAKRLLLEVAYETFENAGMPMKKVAGSRTGVYVGSMTSDYEVLSTRDIYDEPHMAAAGSSEAMTANRVSWFFDLRGPSLTLDTACSSSLYALHLAYQSLRLGETDMGLVAGVSVMLHPNFMQQLVAMHMLSPDGISHTFDERANGYGRGEGIGAVMLKRLSDAIRDGDTVRAVIRGIGSNVDGKTPSVTMPSSEAQASLIREVYEKAGLPLNTTPYVELHGTGTPVGDPIELSAIATTFGAAAPANQPVYVGSIKPNVGHTEGCAGLAGVFKAILSLERGIILPTAEVQILNPKLKLDDWNIALPQEPLAWPANRLRRISVNSFGFGGANAHVILDGAEQYLKERGLDGKTSEASFADGVATTGVNGTPSSAKQKLFVLSTQDASGVARMAKTLGAYLGSKHNEPNAQYLSNVAYTLAFRRSELDHRTFAVADSIQDLAQKLSSPGTSLERVVRRSAKYNRIAFIFTGQGAQCAGMGRQLYGEFDVFTESIARSSRCLQTLGCVFDLENELQRTGKSNIETAEYSQPICTAVQLALVDLLQQWGVLPGAVVGHSSGEIAAAYAARLLTHEDAMKVAYIRGVYSGIVSKGSKLGAMLAAGISEEEAHEYLDAVAPESVVVACVNSPKSVTLSGDANVVAQLEASISADGKFARLLRVMTAYHSPHMRVVAADCLQAMKDANVSHITEFAAGQEAIPMFSSVTGELIDPAELEPSYWIRNMCGTVRFSPAVANLLTGNVMSSLKRRTTSRKAAIKWDALVEIGPHAALKAPLVQIMEGVDGKLSSQLVYTSLLVRNEDAVTTAIRAAGTLWATGVKISLDMVNRDSNAERRTTSQALVDLPSYQWNHEKTFWHESPATKQQRLQKRPRTDLLGAPVENQNPLEPQWRNHLRVRENPWVEDHKITGTILYPGAGMLIMVIEAVAEMTTNEKEMQGIEFQNVSFEKGLVIPQDGSTETILRIQLPQSNGASLFSYSFSIFSRIGDGPWTKNCFGRFKVLQKEMVRTEAVNDDPPATVEWKRQIDKYVAMKQLTSTPVDVTKLYEKLENVGMQYGPTFQNLTELYTVPGADCCYGTAKIPDTRSVMPFEYEFPHLIHPATLDAIFHLIVVTIAGGESLTEAAVPSMLEKLYISFDLPQGHGKEFIGYAERVSRRDNKLCADLVVSDREWSAPKVVVKGLIMTRVSSGPGEPNDWSRKGENEKKTTQLIWKLDTDFAMQSSSIMSLSDISNLRDWLTLECHKAAGLKIAFLGQALGRDNLNDLIPFVNGKSLYRGLSHFSVVDISEDALEAWRSQVTAAELPIKYLLQETWTESETKYDLIIVGKGNKNSIDEMNLYRNKMKPKGRLVILDARRKNSLTNGTHAIEVNGTCNGHTVRDVDVLKLELGDIQTFEVLMGRPEKVLYEEEVLLLVPSVNEPSRGSQLLSEQLSKSGITTRVVSLKEVATLQDKTVICLLHGFFVSIWTSEEFELFQAMISSTKNIFWITHGTQMLQPSQRGLEGAGVPGLLRVLRNEFPQVTIGHLDLSLELDTSDTHGVELVTETFLQFLSPLAEENVRDLEFVEMNGRIFIPRVVSDDGMDMDIALSTGKAQLLRRSLKTCGPLELVTPNTKDAEVETYWQADEDFGKALSPDDVEVAVADISMYPIAASSGSVNGFIGSLVAGIVTECGANVRSFAKGDAVVVLGLRNCKTTVKQHQSLVTRIDCAVPGSAAHVWVQLITSYILEIITYLAAGEKILVLDGNTPLGKVVVRRAIKDLSAQVQAIVTSAEQKEQLINQTGLSRDSITVSSGTENSSALFSHIASKTEGAGIDVVVYAGSGIPVDEELALCLSDLARIAIVVAPGQPPISLPPFEGNISFATVDSLRILTEQPRLVSTLLKRMAETGSKIPDTAASTTFTVSELDEAMHATNALDSNEIISVSLLPEYNGIVSEIRVMPSAPGMPKFDTDATYILAGGLGSLGLRVAELMARNGATHLVLLSRSGGNRHNAKLKKLHVLGCETLVLACDVISQQSVANMVTEVSKTGRPMKGLLQCAMVLQDSLFEKMTYDQWQTAFRPKVVGSWNLHIALPHNMDFFIMLSSVVSVIGNVSQANYAAGNSYMDALAKFRRSLGMAATSINAGLVTDSDHTIDGTTMEDYLKRFKHMASVSTTLSELDIAVAASMRGTVGNSDQAVSPQFVFCMTDSLQPTGADFWASDAKFMHRILREDSDDQSGEAGAGQELSVSAVLAAAATREDAQVAIQDVIKKLLAPGMGVQISEIDAERPLFELGVDSFKAVEVRNQIFRQLKCDVSVFEILSPNSLAYLADQLVLRSLLVSARIKQISDE